MRTINTKYVGKVRWHFDELNSTNDYARLLLNKENVAEGTAIMADRQTAGRGQMGSSWESAPGQNLTLSIILHPNWLKADEQARLGKVAGLAVYDAVADFLTTETMHIKWPNDLIINNKKISGILIENTVHGGHLGSSIWGIGINVQQTDFPDNLPHAGSIQQITGQRPNTAILAEILFGYVEYWYEMLKNGQNERIDQSYLQRLLGYNTERLYALPDSPDTFTGIIREVDAYGRVVVETGGALHRYALKEIRQIL